MSGFTMNTEKLEQASSDMSQLAEGISELGLTKCEDSFDCGDRAVEEALSYFATMYNKRGQTTREWLNSSASGLHITAYATEDTDDEAATVFAALRSKL